MKDETNKEIEKMRIAIEVLAKAYPGEAFVKLYERKAELEAQENEFPFKVGDTICCLFEDGDIREFSYSPQPRYDIAYKQGNAVRIDQRHLLEQRLREQRAETQIRHYCEKNGIAWEWVKGKDQWYVESYDPSSDFEFEIDYQGHRRLIGVNFFFDSYEICDQVQEANREAFKVLAGVTEGE